MRGSKGGPKNRQGIGNEGEMKVGENSGQMNGRIETDDRRKRK